MTEMLVDPCDRVCPNCYWLNLWGNCHYQRYLRHSQEPHCKHFIDKQQMTLARQLAMDEYAGPYDNSCGVLPAQDVK